MSIDNGRFSTVIRADLREWFFALDNKGELVNDLLEAHLQKTDTPTRSFSDDNSQTTTRPRGVYSHDEYKQLKQTDNLIPDPANPKRAYDPEAGEWVPTT